MGNFNELILRLSEEFDQIAFNFKDKNHMEIVAWYGRCKFISKTISYRETIQSIFPLTDMILNDLLEERQRREEKTPCNFKGPNAIPESSTQGRGLFNV